jgi:3-phenylpropionate/cinnamic acid dioxygenase small subunit
VTSTTEPATVQALLDRAEIIDVCVRYATALDSRQWELLATCFEPDARVEFEGFEPVAGIEALVATCRAVLEPLDATQHLIGNHVVTVDGDEAHSQCYLQAQHVRSGAPGGDNYIMAGTYTDDLRRGADGWRITRRRLSITWTSGNPAVVAT